MYDDAHRIALKGNSLVPSDAPPGRFPAHISPRARPRTSADGFVRAALAFLCAFCHGCALNQEVATSLYLLWLYLLWLYLRCLYYL